LRTLADICDEALLELLKVYPLPADAALAATGGYGRREMYPHSDVDVMILLAQEPTEADIQAIEHLVAAMWDIGLEPGHSVRTTEECRQQAAEDVTIETALLEARYLAGNGPLLEHLIGAMHVQLDPQAFFEAKR